MSRLADLWSQEPALIVAAVSAIIAALAVPETWARAVMAVVAVVGGLVTRSQVYAPATVDRLTGPGGGS